LDYPAVGYGIHYEYGLFKQQFVAGRQVEHPDNWLQFGNPWQILRPEYTQSVKLYGQVESSWDEQGNWKPKWVKTKEILGVPWDINIVGYGGSTVNFLRLWESRASEEFDLQVFNSGGYVEAVREKALGETISKVLYPNDATESGKELRLVQQYFFISCSLQDIIRRYRKDHDNWEAFEDKVAVQLNDTHPTIAIPELMRLLMDDYGLDWDKAQHLCSQVFGYTNHTLLPEALEKWSVPLFEKVLPRHLQIIYEINRRFLSETVGIHWPNDTVKQTELSIIEEGPTRMIRMAYLATVVCHSVNGVAALHTDLLKNGIFKDFYQLFPHKFNNKTNGITPRRWLRGANPRLSRLLDHTVGPNWTKDLGLLRQLEPYAEDADFQNQFMAIKKANKEDLAHYIYSRYQLTIDPKAIFDVQIKRLHEYKRQHLNLLYILTLYHRLLKGQAADIHPRVFIFSAKAAPGYYLAKEIIYAINMVAQRINHDTRIGDKLKVVFMPNYSVSLASRIIPAADVSEQISTAGKEASGTGNMKLALNGALTLGTLDGANVEIQEEVGPENIFIFGHTVDEVRQIKAQGYNPWDYYHRHEELRAILDWLLSDYFTPGHTGCLQPLRHALLEGGDPFLVLADYESYCAAQARVDAAYKDPAQWAKKAILNTARVGKFSSDRTIQEYAKDIWKLTPVAVPLS
jgi:starch phosphorylase